MKMVNDGGNTPEILTPYGSRNRSRDESGVRADIIDGASVSRSVAKVHVPDKISCGRKEETRLYY